MKNLSFLAAFIFCTMALWRCQTTMDRQTAANNYYDEQHRLQFHFTPERMWMNDPNGMVYYDGEFHLFYQHYPDDNVWGPMHWGHAISTDLIHWQHMPIAIYPDSLGWIFSGSAVADLNNTSGFGTEDNPPLVAIYTYHDPKGEKAGRDDFQTQGIAYSTDKGRTWTIYEGNPVLGNPGIRDYRDPKVIWHEETNKWVMVLAVKDRVHLYSSPDLKIWNKESDFGANEGAHGGVWECPDLIQMTVDGQSRWVMLVSINPGGPNGGSATQYFVGDFDGRNFKVEHSDIRWLDWGPDNYAGVTWANVEDRHLFIGWMSNWAYATTVPTEEWRSAMTIPRTLELVNRNGQFFVISMPVEELNSIVRNKKTKNSVTVDGSYDLSKDMNFSSPMFDMEFEVGAADFSVVLSNQINEHVTIGYNASQKQFFIDRSNSGKVDFNENFFKRSTADRISNGDRINVRLVVDVGSVELFADDGEVVMTSLFFPNEDFSKIEISSPNRQEVRNLSIGKVERIWNQRGV
jgi:fructan beta-fructosidase